MMVGNTTNNPKLHLLKYLTICSQGIIVGVYLGFALAVELFDIPTSLIVDKFGVWSLLGIGLPVVMSIPPLIYGLIKGIADFITKRRLVAAQDC
jgi:hypothetical protein